METEDFISMSGFGQNGTRLLDFEPAWMATVLRRRWKS